MGLNALGVTIAMPHDNIKIACPACNRQFSTPYNDSLCGTCSTLIINAVRDCLGLAPLQATHKPPVKHTIQDNPCQKITC